MAKGKRNIFEHLTALPHVVVECVSKMFLFPFGVLVCCVPVCRIGCFIKRIKIKENGVLF